MVVEREENDADEQLDEGWLPLRRNCLRCQTTRAPSESPPRTELGRLRFCGRVVGRTALLLAVLLQEFPAKGFDVGEHHLGRQPLGLFHGATPGEMGGLFLMVSNPIWVGSQ